jgi:hypothetical protein
MPVLWYRIELYLSGDLPHWIYISRAGPVKTSFFSGIFTLMSDVADMELESRLPKKPAFGSLSWLVLF